jgi:predicted ATPase
VPTGHRDAIGDLSAFLGTSGAMQDQFGKIQNLQIRGYKSIRDMASLDLDDINIVIGPNGAGKSNFISIFRFLARLVREELQDFVVKQGGLQKLLYFGPQTTDDMAITIRWPRNHYSATFAPTDDGFLTFIDERCSGRGTDKNIRVPHQFETQLRRTRLEGTASRDIYRAIETWRVYHFHDTSSNAPLRSTSPLTEMESLAADGANLAAFLFYLQERHPDAFTAIVDVGRMVAPFLGTLVLRPDARNENVIRLRWRHVGDDTLFDVNDLSDGTLRFVALAALLMQPAPPSTIVLDEPELGLHPAAITQLAAVMHQVAPDVQIIAATQSPTFANQFAWHNFVVVDRAEGESSLRRLSEADVAPWMADLAMGDIWEKNLIGGRP